MLGCPVPFWKVDSSVGFPQLRMHMSGTSIDPKILKGLAVELVTYRLGSVHEMSLESASRCTIGKAVLIITHSGMSSF